MLIVTGAILIAHVYNVVHLYTEYCFTCEVCIYVRNGNRFGQCLLSPSIMLTTLWSWQSCLISNSWGSREQKACSDGDVF